MKIVLTGGGTGGHFYPLIAVAEALEDIATERTLIEPELYYLGPRPFDNRALAEHAIRYIPATAGKLRNYASIWNIFDIFKTGWGILQSIPKLFSIYPDVVLSTGGYAAYPTLWAARLLAIPVVIYDADANPGRVSLWSAGFARNIAIAHPEAAERYPKKLYAKMARIGHPIRKEIVNPAREGGHEFLKLDPSVPTIAILGGSQGAETINNAVLDALPELVMRYNVVHQTGNAHHADVKNVASVVLKDSAHYDRYRSFGLLNTLALRMMAGITSVVVSRAGSGSIFEIAAWGIPAILIPIPEDISRDQTENAFSYARAGAGVVIEQRNLAPHVLVAEVDRLMADETKRATMSEAAHQFARPDAAQKLAEVVIDISLKHEN
jgi:UDP-N-acetylglucosamine--N-acetylmuramyl-(pentapeptide) pyrophosphoryl-undecaprenol N-acetylglucosamine transferase